MWLTRRSEINPFGQTNSVVVSIEHAIVVVHEYIADNEHIVLYLALSDTRLSPSSRHTQPLLQPWNLSSDLLVFTSPCFFKTQLVPLHRGAAAEGRREPLGGALHVASS